MAEWKSEEMSSGAEALELQKRVLDTEIRLIRADAQLEEKRATHLVSYVFKNWKMIEPGLFVAGFLAQERMAGSSDAEVKEEVVRTVGLHVARDTVRWLENVYRAGNRFNRLATHPPKEASKIDVFAQHMEFLVPVSARQEDDGVFEISPKGMKFVEECRAAAGEGTLAEAYPFALRKHSLSA